jgi:hypothetical protein
MVTITAIAIATGLAVPWAAFKPVRFGIVRKLLLRPPATETSHVAGLCLGLPDALDVGQVDHRFPRAGLRDGGPALFPCSARAALR